MTPVNWHHTTVPHRQHLTHILSSDAIGLANNPLGGYGLIADNDLCQRGSFSLDAVASDSAFTTPVANGTTGGAVRTAYVKFTVTEPHLRSPRIYGNPQTNNQGIYGIQNLNCFTCVENISSVHHR